MKAERHGRGQLLRGARALAGYIFGSEDHHRAVYGLAGELPLFMMGGRLCGYTGSLERAIAEKEADAMTPRGVLRPAAKVLPEAAHNSA
jgi:hypothetical protein